MRRWFPPPPKCLGEKKIKRPLQVSKSKIPKNYFLKEKQAGADTVLSYFCYVAGREKAINKAVPTLTVLNKGVISMWGVFSQELSDARNNTMHKFFPSLLQRTLLLPHRITPYLLLSRFSLRSESLNPIHPSAPIV